MRGVRSATSLLAPVGFVIGILAATTATAQAPPPLDLPSTPREELPRPAPPLVEPELVEVLPPPDAPSMTFTPKRIRVRGNSVLDAAALEAIVAPYLDRPLDQTTLEALRRVLTRAYVDAGYVTSGVLVPDQDLANETLVLQVVEGRIAEVQVEGLDRLRPDWVASRIWPDRDARLELGRLSERLSMFQASPDVEAVAAELRPGARLGESILIVRVREGRAVSLALDAHNHRSPRIGSYGGRLRSGLRNVIGVGDALRLDLELTEGVRDVQAKGALPLWPIGSDATRLLLAMRYSDSEVVEAPFDALDIESDFVSLGATLEHTLHETLADRVTLGLGFEWRRSRTRLLGDGFSFSDGVDDGEAVVLPLRLELAWTRRARSRVIAIRTLASFGLPVAAATDLSGAAADGTFVSGLLQVQWAERFERLFGSELVARADLQLTDSPLLPSEQFSIGGNAATRGYRENQVVRDEGVRLSLEWRVPVWSRPSGEPILQVAPFLDWGRAFEHRDRENRDSETLAAAGLGFLVTPHERMRSALYWGQRIFKAERPRDDKDAQDYGIHFSFTLNLY